MNKNICLLLLLLIAGVFHLNAQQECEVEISKKSEKFYEKGRKKYLAAEFSDALAFLRKSIEESPANYEAHLLKAYININPQYRRGSLQSAEKSFIEVVRLCPHADVKSYFYLAEIYYGREEWKKAVKYYDKFLNSDLEGQRRVTENDIEYADEMYNKASFNARIFSNEVPFDPKPVKGVSSKKDEYLAVLSPDHQVMFFTRKVKANQRMNAWDSGDYTEKFMHAHRKTENVFDQGEPMPHPFNHNKNEGGATVTVDNKDLYLTICQNTGRYYNCDICHSHFNGEYWSEIKNLGETVNNDDSWEAMPSITSDGNKIYFVSDREGGFGGYDIYFVTKKADGTWSEAINAGPSINTPGDESSPFIHTDSETLYFSSRNRYDKDNKVTYPGHQGLGGYDIFYIRLGEKDKWTKPRNIGYPINTEDDELGFFVSTDGTKGYFGSNKYSAGGDYDIFYFDLYEEARPEKVLFLKGTLKDEETDQPLEDAKIELRNVENKKVTVIDVDKNTGEYVAVLPFKSDYVMTVKSKKHVYQSRYISRRKPTYLKPVEVNVEMKPFKVGKSYELNDIYFDTDSDKLTDESEIVLKDFVNFLQNNKHIDISIHGYTDNVGDPAYNQRLSEARAKSVYNALVQYGISASRLDYKGFGEANPVADNSTEEGRAKNRRTEFVITSLE